MAFNILIILAINNNCKRAFSETGNVKDIIAVTLGSP